MTAHTKPKVAFFDFTGCEGCQLNKLNLEDHILDVLSLVEIVEFREAMDDRAAHYDIAFIEGSISTPSCVERINDIRRRSDVLVALGSCATRGGVNAMKNLMPIDDVRTTVYGKDKYLFPTLPAQPVSAIVKVDHAVDGCPMTTREYLHVFTSLVLGKKPIKPNHSVCVECKRSENECVFERGMSCMGPVTRGGCEAQCPGVGQYCIGCRGFVDHPEKEAHLEVFRRHGLSLEEARKKMTLFNAYGWSDR
ncbi:MAG: NADH:ubiquinone oxidoreductase [Deltaproteobacteria bacterium]|nr:NADH:ubiquinone oxidoreductase [Deltaproteobacteria bacterium]